MFFHFSKLISVLIFILVFSGCKKEDSDASSTSGGTTGVTTKGATMAGTDTSATPKVVIKYSCMCNPDVVAEDDVPKRLRAKNSSTIEEAKLELTQACKAMKSGDQEVRLFACSERL